MGETITTALETAVTAIKTDALSVIGIVIPLAFAVAGLQWGVRKAIRWFKSLAN